MARGFGKGTVAVTRWIDLPPLWLALFLALAWAIGHLLPLPLFGRAGALIGQALVGLALLGMGWAVLEMTRARTTVIPHQRPAALVTTGPFALSRHPIYLCDLVLLLGAILWLDAPAALPLLPIFAMVLSRRFMVPEEARLDAAFGPAYRAWAARVRRWL